MNSRLIQDAGYLAARAHARRSRMADRAQLERWCDRGAIESLARDLDLPTAGGRPSGWDRTLALRHLAEISQFGSQLAGAPARLLDWMRVRFQLENAKRIWRGLRAGTDPTRVLRSLLPLPSDLAFDVASLGRCGSLTEFLRAIPSGAVRDRLSRGPPPAVRDPPVLLVEAAIDAAYLGELLERTQALGALEREAIEPLTTQEADIHHLQTALRGRFLQDLAGDDLEPLHVPGTHLDAARWRQLLRSADVATAIRHLPAGVLLPRSGEHSPLSVPGDRAAAIAQLEHRAWARFALLAWRALCSGKGGIATLVGYLCLRRVEAADLATLGEGLRLELPAVRIQAHLRTPEIRSASEAKGGTHA